MLLANVYVIHTFGLEESRVVRLLSVLILLIYFLIYKGYKKKSLLIAFTLFVLSDFFILNYEITEYNRLTFITTILGYIFISIHIFPKIKFIKTNNWLFFVFTGILIANTFMLKEIIGMIEVKLIDSIHELLFYVYGLTMIVMLLFVTNYNFRYHSLQSTISMYFVLGFVLSDVFAILAYYLGFEIFYFPDRIFYLLGISMLVWYSISDFGKEIVFEDEFFIEENVKV